MKTKFFSLFLVLATNVGIALASVQVDGIWYSIDNSIHLRATVTYAGSSWYDYNNEYSGSIVIPASVTYDGNTYSVTSIGSCAFRGCTGLTSVTIPNSLTSIDESAFSGCTGLTSVTIPNSVTSIGIVAFAGCGLTSVIIPNSVTYIGNDAFYNIPNIVYNGTAKGSPWGAKCVNGYVDGLLIYRDASKTQLVACSAAATGEIIIPNSVTSIGESAFSGCTGLTGELTIPNSVTSIGSSAFYGCTGLTSTTIGNSVTSIGNNAFSNCTGLTSVIWNAKNQYYYSSTSSPFYDARTRITSFVFGEDVEYIPAYICSELTHLTSIVIGSNVKSIGSYAFANINNRKINRLALPANLETIGSYAFAGNTYLEEIDFGSNLASIGTGAFDQCARVYTMTCLATMTPDVATDALTSISSNAELYVLKNCVQKYKSDANWNRFVIKEIATTETDATGNTVVVEAGDNTATFTWPTNSSSTSYSLEIKKDGETVCTLVFNGEGQLTTIAFAPSKDGRAQSPAATQTASGMQFTVTGLDYATNYSYSLIVKDANSQVIASYSGNFSTNGAEGIDDIPAGMSDTTRKVLIDGQIYILRDGKTFTVQGVELR